MQKKKARFSPRRKLLIGAVILLLAAMGGIYALATRNDESTDDAAIEAHVAPIASDVSGYVVALNVDDNQRVKEGDVLLQIGTQDYQIALNHALAELTVAESRLAAGHNTLATTRVSAPSTLESARAALAAAQSQWNKAASDLRRLQAVPPEARSAQQLDQADAAEKAAAANVEDAKARLKSAATAPQTVAAAESGVQELQAAVEVAGADVAAARKRLDDATIKAPFDGRISRRGVELGAYVQPGQQLMSVVSDDYWVVANYKETQLKRMRPGDGAEIRIDAYPGRKYRGHVDSVQSGTGARFSVFPPENATGNFVKIVQRVPVKIVFDEKPDASLPVGPGMSVEPVVHVQ